MCRNYWKKFYLRRIRYAKREAATLEAAGLDAADAKEKVKAAQADMRAFINRTGRGKIRVRAVSNIETLPNGKSQIIITELPYMVNKARLIEKIAELVKDKKIDGITGLNDHSSREGMRICIDLRKDANANVILNQLYKHTQLQDTFGVIMLALVNNEPKVMNLKEMLEHYLAHQEYVVTRRTKYDLNKARERAHILEGLLKALDNIDRVIQIIRGSQNTQIAKVGLMEELTL